MSNKKQYEFYEGDNFLSQLQTTDSQLYNYTIELCHKLDMKALKLLNVTEVYTDSFSFYNLRDSRFKKKEKVAESGTFPTVKAVALTYKGFINAVIFCKTSNKHFTYFYCTGKHILDKGDTHLMRSRHMNVLVRKILDGRKPITDTEILDLRGMYKHMSDAVSNMHGLESDYRRIEICGKDLHTALELALAKDKGTTHKCDGYMEDKLHSKLKRLKEQWDKIVESDKILEDTMSKPFHLICHSMSHDETECIILKCAREKCSEKVINNSDWGIKVLDMEHCKDIKDYKDYESIVGLLTIYKVALEDSHNDNTQYRLDGLLKLQRYGISFNKDVQIGHITAGTDNRSTRSISKTETLFILNT